MNKGPTWPEQVKLNSAVLSGIFAILLIHGLQVAAPIIIPTFAALLVSLLLSPVVRRLEIIRIPASIGAFAVVLLLVAMLTAALLFLSDPAVIWLQELPSAIRKLENGLGGFLSPLGDLQKAAEAAEDATAFTESNPAVKVKVQTASLTGWMLSSAPTTVAGFLTTFVLVYFMLASGDRFLRRLVEQIPRLRDKKNTVEIVREIQTSLSRYLVTISLINFTLGLLTAITLMALGVPNPFLWGALAGILNFAPYIGPLITLLILTMVGVMTFDNMIEVLMLPVAFFVLTAIEGQLITPTITGRHLELNPVAILLAILLLGWLWGIVGILMAVPVLVSIKITCDRFDAVKSIAVFLERYPS